MPKGIKSVDPLRAELEKTIDARIAAQLPAALSQLFAGSAPKSRGGRPRKDQEESKS